MDTHTLVTLLGEAVSTAAILGYIKRYMVDTDRRISRLEQIEDKRSQRAMAAHGGD